MRRQPRLRLVHLRTRLSPHVPDEKSRAPRLHVAQPSGAAFAGIGPPFAENLLTSASPPFIIVIEVQQ